MKRLRVRWSKYERYVWRLGAAATVLGFAVQALTQGGVH